MNCANFSHARMRFIKYVYLFPNKLQLLRIHKNVKKGVSSMSPLFYGLVL